MLNPQPSDDPNDPLNWPMFKKELITAILCLGGMLNAATNVNSSRIHQVTQVLLTRPQGPLLNASYFPMSQQLGMPISKVVTVSGYNLLAAGCIGPFVCAISRKYGKRPVYLASTLFDIIGTAIGESKISYKYLLAARIVQGFSTSAFESLVVASIGDMYFVHQRGLRIAILNFIITAANGLATIICGQVFESLGWLWLFHLFQIFLVIQFLAMVFFVPETTYIREAKYETDVARDDITHSEKMTEMEYIEHAEPKNVGASVERPQSPAPETKKKTFLQEMAVFTGVYHHDYIIKDLAGPFLTLLNPAACYAVITSGTLNAWYVGSAIVTSGIFSGPPWNYTSAQVGYLGTGPLLGGLVGAAITGLGSDHVIKFMTKRNRGT